VNENSQQTYVAEDYLVGSQRRTSLLQARCLMAGLGIRNDICNKTIEKDKG